MKGFIRNVLIVICVIIFITSIMQGFSKKETSSIDSNINEFEENINNGEIISDYPYIDSKEGIEETSNLFGIIASGCSKVVIFIVNSIIKIILFIVQKIV